MSPRLNNFRKAKVIQVIEVECCEGQGLVEDPYREVRYYLAMDGALLAKNDYLGTRTLNITTGGPA